MFRRRQRLSHPDFSVHFRDDIRIWNITPEVFSLEAVTELSTVTADTHSQLFAVGTSKGKIRVYDEKFRESILTVPNGSAVRILQFARPREHFKLLCFDNDCILHIWNLDALGSPRLQASHPFNTPIFYISTCSSHAHALLATGSGVVTIFDIINLQCSPYHIPHALNHGPKSPALSVLILPDKLNYVLIGYADGVVLWDMVSRTKAGAFLRDFAGKSAALTALSLHPAGQHFSAGYEDGFLCIWNLSDSKQVWTGTVDGNLHLGQAADTSQAQRGPIFKTEWIYPEDRGAVAKSWLIVLGGQKIRTSPQKNGITALEFDSIYLDAYSSNSVACRSYVYPSIHAVQDFAIVLDPNTPISRRILFISGDGGQETSIDAFAFPPISTGVILQEDKTIELEFSVELEESEETSRDLTSTLDELKADSENLEEPCRTVVSWKPLPLPYPLSTGGPSLIRAEMVSLDRTAYVELIGQPISEDDAIFRLMFTCHIDSSVRFYDVSLIRNSNLSRHPYLLDRLTIRVLEIPEIALRPDISTIRVTDVNFSRRSLECIVQLSTGEIVAFGPATRQRTQPVSDDELVDIDDVRDVGEFFKSRFILKPRRGDPVIVSTSDIGFLAVVYQHDYIVVVDMRGPRIILREVLGRPSVKNVRGSTINSLTWITSAIGDDHIPRPRLLAMKSDGSMLIYTLTCKERTWMIDTPRTIQHTHSSPLTEPLMSVILDSQTGQDCYADPSNLAKFLEPETVVVPSSGIHCYLVAGNRRQIRVYANITGGKMCEISLSSQEAVDYLNLVWARDSVVLGSISREKIIMYSVPALEAIHSFKLPILSEPRKFLSWTSAGDILQTNVVGSRMRLIFIHILSQSNSAQSGTVNFRLHKSTIFQNASKQVQTPATDNTWGSAFTGWIKGLGESATYTGDDIDMILTDQRRDEGASSSISRPENGQIVGEGTTSLSALGQGVYQRMAAAAAERGERLGELQEHIQQLEAGSRDLVTQAKRMAEKQATKSWFPF